MIEKDTLIKILDCCIEDDCYHCPNAYKYSGIAACEDFAHEYVSIPYSIMRETIEALKEQEPSKPIVHENSYGWKFYYCPKCKQEFYQNRKQAYCDKCGKAVKWDD